MIFYTHRQHAETSGWSEKKETDAAEAALCPLTTE
jgi:hypothetical protein